MTRMMRHVLFAVLCILTFASLPTVFSAPAHASTVYDGAYTSVDELRVGQDHFYNSQTCNESVDLTHSWQSYILDPDAQLATGYNTEYATLRTSFQNAVASGSYGVSQTIDKDFYTPSNYLKAILVYWTEDSDAEVEWKSFGSPARYGVDYSSVSSNIHFAHIGNKIGVMGTGGCEIGWASPDLTGYSSLSSFFNWVSTDVPSGIYGYHANTSLFVKGADIIEPVDYEGGEVVEDLPSAKYVAMGDSFSSGEGNPAFEYWTDEDDENECHRSPKAYPRLLDSDLSLSTKFVACSGATTDNVNNGGSAGGAWGEEPQVGSVSLDTDFVTITIGGNDIEFSQYADACVSGSCSATSTEYLQSWVRMTDENNAAYLPDRLETVLSGIATGLTSGNTSARVLVIGYPYIVTEDAWEWNQLQPTNRCAYLSSSEAEAAEVLVGKLNEVIYEAVDDFNDSRFLYIDPNMTGSPFNGHEICREDAYFNPPDTGNTEYSFHPDDDGQFAYKQIVDDYLD